jgi:hypothetical protein
LGLTGSRAVRIADTVRSEFDVVWKNGALECKNLSVDRKSMTAYIDERQAPKTKGVFISYAAAGSVTAGRLVDKLVDNWNCYLEESDTVMVMNVGRLLDRVAPILISGRDTGKTAYLSQLAAESNPPLVTVSGRDGHIRRPSMPGLGDQRCTERQASSDHSVSASTRASRIRPGDLKKPG